MNLTGSVIANRYEIIEEIGSGGMAIVYKAKCQLLNRFVAVKVLRTDLQNDKEFVRRFNVEAQAAASLAHPNIVSIYDVGNENGLHYIVMEYVEGKTLKEYIDEKEGLPWREAVDYAIQIAKGIDQAHKNSIIHRDVKPHNIIMTSDGVMKVTDFGIARANVQTTMTCDDTAIGSVHYISPEQARGGYTDERSDIYSLGITLYEMLTGVVPFDSDRPVTIAIKHIQEAPRPPREHNISIPLALEKIVLKMIAKEVSARYKSVSELIEDMQSVLYDPSRKIVLDTENADGGQTIMMPAVKHSDVSTPVKEAEEMVAESKNKSRESRNVMDRKKEKKVIVFAIISALLVILTISFAFLSISGIGDMLFGSRNIEIPSIEGMLYEDAVEKYKDEPFSIVKGEYAESDEEEGTIINQEPRGGDKVKKTEEIVIKVVLSEGSNEVYLKNYTKYKDVREVEIEVKELGLRAEVIEEYSDTFPIGSIISQEPSAGRTIKKGETVVFYVSKGPEEKENVGGETNTPNPGVNDPGTNDNPTVNPKPAEKSTMLTIYGPRDKESALVQINVNGTTQYSKKLSKGQSDVVKLKGTTSEVTVEILHDGVSIQKSTVKLH